MIARVLLVLTLLAVLAWLALVALLWLLEHVLAAALARAAHGLDLVVCALAVLTLGAWFLELRKARTSPGS